MQSTKLNIYSDCSHVQAWQVAAEHALVAHIGCDTIKKKHVVHFYISSNNYHDMLYCFLRMSLW